MQIDYSPLPETMPSIKIRHGFFILCFILWTLLLFGLTLLGGALNIELLMRLPVQVWMISVLLLIMFFPIPLFIYLYIKGRQFEADTDMYLRSFSYANSWNLSTFSGEASLDNKYMPPWSKKQKLTSYTVSTLWTIDMPVSETQIVVAGLRYFKHNIGGGNFSPHYMTVALIPRQLLPTIEERPNVQVEHDDLYWYVYVQSIAIRQSEMKSLLNPIDDEPKS